MNTNIPDNLMANVEKNLRKHVKDKRRKKYILKSVAATISLLIILPASTFAFAKYNDSIQYKQEIDLARENNNITEVNKTFKYRNVDFTIKEILADDTGIEVIYDVSDPKYSINQITFADKDNKEFNSWGCNHPNFPSDNKEKSFVIQMDSDTANYMTDNPVTISITNLELNEDGKSDNLIDKVTSLINKDSNLTVDWTLKMQIPMQQVNLIPINKEYCLDIGTLKINSFKVGVLKSMLDYSFEPKDNTIGDINPLFSVRFDKEYTMRSGCLIYSGGTTGSHGTQTFDSIYYKNIDEIGITLIGVQTTYNLSNSTVYKIYKNNLPMEFDFNGEKFKIISMEQNDDSNKYTIEYPKINRQFSELYFENSDYSGSHENVQFKDQASLDLIYNSLSKRIPNFKDIEKKFYLKEGTIKTELTTGPGKAEFRINGACKNLVYDEDEVIIHK